MVTGNRHLTPSSPRTVDSTRQPSMLLIGKHTITRSGRTRLICE